MLTIKPAAKSQTSVFEGVPGRHRFAIAFDFKQKLELTAKKLKVKDPSLLESLTKIRLMDNFFAHLAGGYKRRQLQTQKSWYPQFDEALERHGFPAAEQPAFVKMVSNAEPLNAEKTELSKQAREHLRLWPVFLEMLKHVDTHFDLAS